MTDSSQRRILVVEDDEDIRSLLTHALRKRYSLTMATDGQDALDQLEQADPLPDLIITDVMMPRVDGLKMVKILRADEQTARIPVIFLTGRGGPGDILSAVTAGAVHYITKPFNVEDLLQAIERVFAA